MEVEFRGRFAIEDYEGFINKIQDLAKEFNATFDGQVQVYETVYTEYELIEDTKTEENDKD